MTPPAAAAPDAPPSPPRRRPGRALRAAAALLFVGLPLLMMGALATGWIWSHQAQEEANASRVRTTTEVGGGTSTQTFWRVQIEADAGWLGLTLHRRATTQPASWTWTPYSPDGGTWVGDWHWRRGPFNPDPLPDPRPRSGRMPSEATPPPVDEDEWVGPLGFLTGSWSGHWSLSWPDSGSWSFGRGGKLTGWTGGADWQHESSRSAAIGFRKAPRLSHFVRSTTSVVAPFWAWIVPWLVPVVAWCWCPPGRPLPRLSVRRALLATAGPALYLGALLHVPAEDRAILALHKFNPQWLIGPAPDGSGRTVIGAVALFDQQRPFANPARGETAPIRSALEQLAYLQVLSIGSPFVKEEELLPDDLPHLAILDLGESMASDATLARVGRYRGLRELLLNNARVTGAGLAHLRGLAKLEYLDLTDADLSDASLALLEGFPRLRRLNLGSPRLAYLAARSAWIDARLRRLADALAALAAASRLGRITSPGAAGPADLLAALAAASRPEGLPAFPRFRPGSLLVAVLENRGKPLPTSPLSEGALRRLADSLPSLEELTRPDGTALRPDRPASAAPGPGRGP